MYNLWLMTFQSNDIHVWWSDWSAIRIRECTVSPALHVHVKSKVTGMLVKFMEKAQLQLRR